MKLSEIKPNKSNPRLIKDDKFKCLYCGNQFTSDKACKSRTPKYCSKEYYAKSLLKLKVCPVCGKSYPSNPNTKYCSVNCFKVGRPSRKGIKLSDEWKKALSEGRRNSDKCKGEKLYNWKGGKETISMRSSISASKRRSLQTMELDRAFLDRLLIAQNGLCFFCGGSLQNYKAIEHLTPLSRGGDNQNYNIVYACQSCNSKKRQQTLEEYAINERRFDWLDKFDEVYADSLS